MAEAGDGVVGSAGFIKRGRGRTSSGHDGWRFTVRLKRMDWVGRSVGRLVVRPVFGGVSAKDGYSRRVGWMEGLYLPFCLHNHQSVLFPIPILKAGWVGQRTAGNSRKG